jgi:tetratricopeptide (TPR) repeat protein
MGAVLGLTALILVPFSYKTITRNTDWRDNFTLFTTDVLASPQSAQANGAAGQAFIVKAQQTQDSIQRAKYLQKGILYLSNSVKLYDGFYNGWINLGQAYLLTGNWQETERCWTKAASIIPTSSMSRQALAILSEEYVRRGNQARTQNDMAAMQRHLIKALEYNPANAVAAHNLAIVYAMANQMDEALKYFIQAADVNPNEPSYHCDVAITLIQLKRYTEAKQRIDYALKLQPNHPGANALAAQVAPFVK